MAIKTTIKIDVDFYDKKHILINAKQLDKGSRLLEVTCYNHGELFKINDAEYAAYVRYRKADDYGVFNLCKIRNNKIEVEITEQMLSVEGICVADLVIVVKNGEVQIDPNTGVVTGIDNTYVLSTMPIYIDVTEAAVHNSEIESSYEFSAFNTDLEYYWANFKNVVQTSRSWAEGSTGIRKDEDTNNAKYWAGQSESKATAAGRSVQSAKASESQALIYKNQTLEYMGKAEGYMNTAETHMNNAETYKSEAADSASASSDFAADALTSQGEAKKSADAASDSAVNAEIWATQSQSYAIGNTGARPDEDVNNAQYYYENIRSIVVGVDSGFRPMGSIEFSELDSLEPQVGDMYKVKDGFITDERFQEPGVEYLAETNIYYTGNGVWDCFRNVSSPVATVAEVMDYLGIPYTNEEENEEGTEIV